MESGLVHMRARQYDPRLGRFTQRDPMFSNRALKHYMYANCNPVSINDPLGLYDWGDLSRDAAAFGRSAVTVVRGVIEPVSAALDVVDTLVVAGTNATGLTDVSVDRMYFFSLSANATRNRVLSGEQPATAISSNIEEFAWNVDTLGQWDRVKTHANVYKSVSSGEMSGDEGTRQLREYETT